MKNGSIGVRVAYDDEATVLIPWSRIDVAREFPAESTS